MLSKKSLFILFSIGFVACHTSPEKAILKRWKISGMKGNNHNDYFGNRQAEIEFKDGNMVMYENGMIRSTYGYTMASDGQSFLIKSPSGTETMPAKIIQLNSKELSITSEMFGTDTLIMKAN
jgi:hypothetical protein